MFFLHLFVIFFFYVSQVGCSCIVLYRAYKSYGPQGQVGKPEKHKSGGISVFRIGKFQLANFKFQVGSAMIRVFSE